MEVILALPWKEVAGEGEGECVEGERDRGESDGEGEGDAMGEDIGTFRLVTDPGVVTGIQISFS